MRFTKTAPRVLCIPCLKLYRDLYSLSWQSCSLLYVSHLSTSVEELLGCLDPVLIVLWQLSHPSHATEAMSSSRPLKRTYSRKGKQPLFTSATSQRARTSSPVPPTSPARAPSPLRLPLDDKKLQDIAAKKSLDPEEWLERYARYTSGDLEDGENDEDTRSRLSREEEEKLNKRLKASAADLSKFRLLSGTQRVINPAQAAPLPPPLVRDNLHENKKIWRKLYKKGLPELAHAVMEEEIDARLAEKKGLCTSDLDWTARVMEQILLLTDKFLLESVMFGNLARDKRNHPQLKAILAELRQQSLNQPGIYMQQLVNDKGESPSANQLLKAVEIMLGYVRGCNEPETASITDRVISDSGANRTDSFKRVVDLKKTKTGFRKYMYSTRYVQSSSGSSNTTSANASKKVPVENFSAAHAKETIAFAEALRKRIHAIPISDRDLPLEFPLVEVGYSMRCIVRLKAHARHDSSNYIMNLMEAIFGALSNHFDNEIFRIEQEVIYLIWSVEQAEISEIGWTKLAEGYIHNAGGFSHYPAGLSNASARKILPPEWSAAKKYLVEHSAYRFNLEFRRKQEEDETAKLEGKAAAVTIERTETRRARSERLVKAARNTVKGLGKRIKAPSVEGQRLKDDMAARRKKLREVVDENVGHAKKAIDSILISNKALIRMGRVPQTVDQFKPLSHQDSNDYKDKDMDVGLDSNSDENEDVGIDVDLDGSEMIDVESVVAESSGRRESSPLSFDEDLPYASSSDEEAQVASRPFIGSHSRMVRDYLSLDDIT